MARREEALLEVLRQNRAEALDVSGKVGQHRLLGLLARADADLTVRLGRVARTAGGPGRGSFTGTQLEVARRQVRDVTRHLTRGLGALVMDHAGEAADQSATHLLEYLGKADRAFRGVGTRPLALKEASIFDQAVSGAETTVLRRLASSDAEGDQPARMGILQRYGVETVGRFEQTMQLGLVAQKSWADVRDDLAGDSSFLRGAPRHWAERILRTETMAASNASAQLGMKAADQELGDMVKILSAVFDDRTASDSYATHGQIRRVNEPFVTWYGPIQYPPDRPNDRGTTIPHRVSWPIPPSLAWRSYAEVAAAWKREGRRGSPPPPPRPMTTIDLEKFGASTPPPT